MRRTTYHDEDGGGNEIVQLVREGAGEVVVAGGRGEHGNKELSGNDGEVRDGEDGPDAKDVAADDEEGILCRHHERGAVDGRLDVGVLANELHAALEAPQAALHAAEGDLDRGVGLHGLRHLLLHVENDGTDELNDGNEEGAKGARAEVVTQHRQIARQQRAAADVSHAVDGVGEVPLAHSHSDDHLPVGADKVHGPEQAEEEEPQLDARVVAAIGDPLLACGIACRRGTIDGEGGVLRDPGAHGGEVQAVNNVWDHENDEGGNLENGGKDHEGHLLDRHGSHRHALDGNVNVFAHEEHEAEVEARDTHHDAGKGPQRHNLIRGVHRRVLGFPRVASFVGQINDSDHETAAAHDAEPSNEPAERLQRQEVQDEKGKDERHGKSKAKDDVASSHNILHERLNVGRGVGINVLGGDGGVGEDAAAENRLGFTLNVAQAVFGDGITTSVRGFQAGSRDVCPLCSVG